MRNVVIIKVYANGKSKVLSGERKEGEIADDTAQRIIKENGMRNTGEFIVISRSGDEGAFITQFMEGIGLNNGYSTIWVGDTQVLIEALNMVVLRNSLNVEISKDEDGLWVAEIKEINAVGVGETIKEAFSRLGENLEVAIETYMNEDDANLTESAIELKRTLKEIVGGMKNGKQYNKNKKNNSKNVQ